MGKYASETKCGKLSNNDIYIRLKWVEYYLLMDKFNWLGIYLLPAKVANNVKLLKVCS